MVHVKQVFTDPYIILAGDFNQWDISNAITDFPDLKEAPVGQTRGDLSIDRIFTNLSRSIKEAGSLSPLENQDGSKQSDHRIAFCKAEMAKLRTFTWQKYT